MLIPVAVAGALAAMLVYATRDALFPRRSVQTIPVLLIPVSAAQPAPGSGATLVQAAGWIEPDPYPIPVSTLADGIVREVLALEGEAVEAGQVLVRLVDDDARLALARAEADLEEKSAAFEAARATWDHPIERRRAADVAEASVAQARAEVARVAAELAQQRARLAELADQRRRAEESAASRSLSESEIVSRRLQHEAQSAVVEATERQGEALAASLLQREAELQAARRNLELRIEERRERATAHAAMTRAAVERDEARLRLERMTLRSPINGVVLARHVTPGSKLIIAMDGENSATAMHLYDPAALQVRVDVPQADAGKVAIGQPARVSVAVLGERELPGVVTRALHEADVARNTVQFKVRILEPNPQLRPEMLARVRFLNEPKSGDSTTTRPSGAAGLFAPRRAISVRSDGSADAWVFDRRSGTAARRTLALGPAREQDWVQVDSGLFPGDDLIADAAGLRDGQRVRFDGEAD